MREGEGDRKRRRCLPLAGRREGSEFDGLISGSDYLLITIRREQLEEEENM